MQSPESARSRVVGQLADMIAAVERSHPVRVAIDGRSAAGKSTFCDELASAILARGRAAIRVSIDDFYGLWVDKHNRRFLTAETFYTGAYDYATLRALVLEPLGPGGSRRYRARWHHGWNEGEFAEPEQTAPDDAVLLVEGVFLLRPELDDAWDLRIFLYIDATLSLERGVERDLALEDATLRASRRVDRVRVYEERYIPAEERYFREIDPAALAEVVIDNRVFEEPRIVAQRRTLGGAGQA